jgi:tetratricopeptide (TPR) repeat protein
MRHPLISNAFVLLTLVLASAAQMDVSHGDVPLKRAPALSQPPTRIFVSGKVAVDDGSPPPDRAEVETVCNGQKRTRARTDSHGGFSFNLSSEGESAGAEQSAASGADNSWGGEMAPRRSEPDWQGCEVDAVLTGFTSEKVQFARRITDLGENNIGQITLHRLGQVEGLTISITTALAPEDAKKAFAKGLERETKHNWEEAQSLFEKAIQIYPRYALAWFELGRVQLQKNNNAEAQHCWEQAIAADPKYVLPYQMLAQMATGQGHWPQLIEVTGKWLELDPANFPDAWFLNAVGHYFAGNRESAEKSALEGIKLDQGHRIPKLQYLLGMALMQRQAYVEAAEHMRLYLHLVSKPADVAEAQKQLAEIERLSASATVAGGGQKQ